MKSERVAMGRYFIAGHEGLVGSAFVRAIERVGEDWIGERRERLDLLNRLDTFAYLHDMKPDVVVIAAARVGGIEANKTFPVQFLSENVQIACNILDGSFAADIPRVLFLGSSCIYPKFAPQPIPEEALLTGPLEPTNEAYALAKIAGLKLLQSYRAQYQRDWISAMPTNLYGPGDNFDPVTSHVLPATVTKFLRATERGDKTVTMWGSGQPRREFLHVDDCASACLHLLEHYNGDSHVNVGTGKDVSIAELAEHVSAEVGFEGRIEWDLTKPDGTPRKLLDVSRLEGLGWQSSISLKDGIRDLINWLRSAPHSRNYL